jgi:hypothetical protein
MAVFAASVLIKNAAWGFEWLPVAGTGRDVID